MVRTQGALCNLWDKFIAMAVTCGWEVDGLKPGGYDMIEVVIAILSVCTIIHAPKPA